ncbi:hypothetical protein HBI68_256030, partial [Parastagonospora nodorum]
MSYVIFPLVMLATLVLLLKRLYARYAKETLSLGDLFLVVSYMFSLPVNAVLFWSWQTGVIGAHAWELSKEQLETFFR